MNDDLLFVLGELSMLEEDSSLPKNVRGRVTEVLALLQAETPDLHLRLDRSLEELGAVAEDPNLPAYARTQLWGILSSLESSARN